MKTPTFGNNPAADIELMRRVRHGKIVSKEPQPIVLLVIAASVLCVFALTAAGYEYFFR